MERRGWQSESDGFATGTEGYVKYRIEGTENGDTVYLYWDNPFTLGVTHAKGQVSAEDIEPDCDFDKTGGGSAFSRPSQFEVFGGNEFDVTSDGDTAALELVGELPLAPFFIFASAGISEHAVKTFTLIRKPTNLRRFASRRKLDLSSGVRSIAPGVSSLRSLLGLK